MEKCLLSIDWDYFIGTHLNELKSYMETDRNIVGEWYKDYFYYAKQGIELEELFWLDEGVESFWNEMNPCLNRQEDVPIILSESHTAAYEVAKNTQCDEVYLIDAHSDLGYGGLASLQFETNCANWLGKLFHDEMIKKAHIIYSPYTHESPEQFKEITETYDIDFLSLDDVLHQQGKIDVGAIHICRSGPWTPPWYDKAFEYFTYEAGNITKSYIDEMRTWHPKKLTLADRISCEMGII